VAFPLAADSTGLFDEVVAFLDTQTAVPGHNGGTGGDGDPSMLRVLLPYAGSEAADCAVEALLKLAPMLSAQVRVVHVREWDNSRAGPFFLESRAAAVALTRDATVRLRRHDVVATGVVRDANRDAVARTILTEADEFNASVVLLGARRRRALTKFVTGSVSGEVMRRASYPVILIHAGRPPRRSLPADPAFERRTDRRRPAA
jgi:nucleotide-binding universal stress UspA family protein